MDLDTFASQKRQRRCTTCALDPDILGEIHAGRARDPKPVPFATISKWLEEHHGVTIQHSTIRAHFIAGHQL